MQTGREITRALRAKLAARVTIPKLSHFPIAYKLALLITLLITGGMALLGLLVLKSQSSLLHQQMDSFGATLARQFAESIREPLLADDRLTLEVIASNAATQGRTRGVTILTEARQELVAVGTQPPPRLLPATESSVEWVHRPENGPEEALITFFRPVTFQDLTAGFVALHFDRSLMAEGQLAALRTVVSTMLLMVGLGIIASLLLAKRLTRPIHQLIEASKAISAGNYRVRLEQNRRDELGSLIASINAMSEGLLRKEQVEKTFSRYVSPKVAKEVLGDLERVQLGGIRVCASVVFADIVGFTRLSESLAPEQVSALLNDYFSHIDRAALAFGGHIDKYMGDCAMLVFGVPEPDPDHAFNAVACAVLIQRLVERLNRQRESAGQIPVQFRIGVNAGEMLAGNMGSSERMEYTVVGDAVNLASRLAGVAEAGEIVLSETMRGENRLASRLVADPKGSIRLRGKSEPVTVYRILDVSPAEQPLLQARLAEVSPLGEGQAA